MYEFKLPDLGGHPRGRDPGSGTSHRRDDQEDEPLVDVETGKAASADPVPRAAAASPRC